MITTSNYYQEVAKIGVNRLPETLKKSHDFVEKVSQQGKSWDTYNKNETIKRTIDLYFSKLTDFSKADKQSEVKSKKNVQAKEKKYVYDGETFDADGIIKRANTDLHYEIQDNDAEEFTDADEAFKALKASEKVPKTSKKAKNPKVAKLKTNSKSVERLGDDVAIIKRYVAMHGKNRTKAQCINLLKALQKAILEKRIGKHSEFGKEVLQIQESLIILAKDRSEGFKIEISERSLARYNEIIESVAPMTSISLLKRYIGLIGKTDIKDKVKRLAEQFQRAFDKGTVLETDKYIVQIKDAYNNLQNHIAGNDKMLRIDEASLKGLQGLSGLGNPIAFAASAIIASYFQNHIKEGIEKLTPKKKEIVSPGIATPHSNLGNPEVMTVSAAKAQSFKKIGLTGDLRKLIGDACEPTSIFIYGPGGSGKSSLSLRLADELNKLKKSILYVAGEQFNTPSFSKLLETTNVTGNERFKIVKRLDTLPINGFDVIVIDSKDSVGLTASSEFKAMRDAHPTKLWIITSQGTKAGDFTGDEKWRNEVDCMVYCENGTASTLLDKNRWGGKAEIILF